jgi:DNA-binding NtrC family response regulator
MSAAVSYPSIRPVLPRLRPTNADREEASCLAGTVSVSAHRPTSEAGQVLVIEDPAGLADSLHPAFPAPSYCVRAASGLGGLRHARAEFPDVVVLDLDLPESGLDVYRQLREIDARVPVVFVIGARRADAAIEAMKLGAYDVLFKPVPPAALRRVVSEALDVSRHMRESALRVEPGTDPDAEGELVGLCPAMEQVYKAVGRVADQNFPVLITGESGTGKELVARAIHRHSKRADRPLLAINSAAIPASLLESELFGHERGAFTGADRRRIGKFEQCNGGTIFLDEVGDMPLALQAKVLRLLQEQSFERVGGNETIRTDVRLIAATHHDLKKESAAGTFRGDLYYRLGVFAIHLPPLRERGDDLALLVRHYVRRFGRELGREVREVAPAALERLRAYPWAGNIRELQSVLKQALLHASGPTLLPAFLPELPEGRGGPTPGLPEGETPGTETFVVRQRVGPDVRDLYAEAHRQLDQLLLPVVLEHTGGSQHQAALLLGIARQTLRLKLRDLGLSASRPTEAEGDPG